MTHVNNISQDVKIDITKVFTKEKLEQTINARSLSVSNTNCIIVAGGVTSGSTSALNSTEVLNDEVGATWQSGPPLPEPITAATMVGYPYGEGVLMMGGFASDPNSVTMTKIYYLRDCSSQSEGIKLCK